jgi:competence protein ComEC
MNGKCLYFAIAALFAILSMLLQFLSFFVLTLIYIYFLYKYKRFTKVQLIAIVTIVLLFLLIGEQAAKKNTSIIPETAASFRLEFIQDPKIDGDLLQILALETRYNEKLLIRYQIKSEEEKTVLENTSFYNCLCLVSGTMEKPKIAKNPNGFNYQEFLEAKQIYWIVDTEKNPLQTCSTRKSSPIVLVKQLRFSGVHYLETYFPPEIASLSAALIFGDRSMIDSELLGDYQKTGIVHLLAISGLHVSLLIGTIFYLGIRIGFTRQFMGNFLLVILPVYGLLTGASPSVIRACLMIFLVLIAAKWKSKLKLLSIDAISLAFIVYLFWNPFIIFDIGFQLSFSVSLAIILSAQHILNNDQGKTAQMLATSVTSQLAALPFLLYHYFQMPLIGLLANMLYIPLFSFIYLPGLYLLFLLQFLFGSTPSLLITLFVKIITLSNQLIEIFSHFSLANFTPGKPNLLFLMIYILLILVIFYIWETKFHFKWKTHLLVCSFLLFTLQPGWNWLNPFGEVTMIDVGQGDSIFIHLPFGKGDYLIDTGGTLSFSEEKWKQRAKPFEVGRDIVVPYLKAKGITKIDKLILTHGDMDHVGGAFSIIKELKVKQIFLPDVAEESQTELEIMKAAELRGIPVIKGSTGMQWRNGENSFYILSPEKNFRGERNTGSLTILAQIGGLSWFFGGDLDKLGEERIIKHFPQLTVDVLKVGHHGSKTSSSPLFIKQIKPRVALISVGEKNRFGHPHQEVLQLLEKENTRIYRTDSQGAITYRFFGGEGTFSPYLQ